MRSPRSTTAPRSRSSGCSSRSCSSSLGTRDDGAPELTGLPHAHGGLHRARRRSRRVRRHHGRAGQRGALRVDRDLGIRHLVARQGRRAGDAVRAPCEGHAHRSGCSGVEALERSISAPNVDPHIRSPDGSRLDVDDLDEAPRPRRLRLLRCRGSRRPVRDSLRERPCSLGIHVRIVVRQPTRGTPRFGRLSLPCE